MSSLFFWGVLEISQVRANLANVNIQKKEKSVAPCAAPYDYYDEKFLVWKRGIEEFLGTGCFIKIVLFVPRTSEEKYGQYVLFKSNEFKQRDFVKSAIKHSVRVKWPLEEGREVRVTVEKMAVGEINFSDEENEYSIYIMLSSFQERNSGYYLEFRNVELKNWVDAKVREFSEINPIVGAYNTESGKVLDLVKWYKHNTRFHPK